MSSRTILLLAGLVLALVLAFAVWLLGFSEWPGGMRPSYAAEDYDPRLTEVAATAKPVIAALQRYHDDHAAFPEHVADLVSYLASPSETLMTPRYEEILGWSYTRLKTGYVLSRGLGWDPLLKYFQDESGARWVFDPGDGSPQKTILLKP